MVTVNSQSSRIKTWMRSLLIEHIYAGTNRSYRVASERIGFDTGVIRCRTRVKDWTAQRRCASLYIQGGSLISWASQPAMRLSVMGLTCYLH